MVEQRLERGAVAGAADFDKQRVEPRGIASGACSFRRFLHGEGGYDATRRPLLE